MLVQMSEQRLGTRSLRRGRGLWGSFHTEARGSLGSPPRPLQEPTVARVTTPHLPHPFLRTRSLGQRLLWWHRQLLPCSSYLVPVPLQPHPFRVSGVSRRGSLAHGCSVTWEIVTGIHRVLCACHCSGLQGSAVTRADAIPALGSGW